MAGICVGIRAAFFSAIFGPFVREGKHAGYFDPGNRPSAGFAALRRAYAPPPQAPSSGVRAAPPDPSAGNFLEEMTGICMAALMAEIDLLKAVCTLCTPDPPDT